MNLYDEEQRRKEKQRNERLKRIVTISIIFSIILIIALVIIIYYLIDNPNRVVVNLNGKESRALENIITVEESEDGTNSTIYAPIKEIAQYFGYQAFNGEYTIVSEDTDSCYVENEEEVAIFNLGSNIIYKIDKNAQDNGYEYCKLDKEVFEKNGVLYTSSQGLEEAFNIYFNYNERKKTIDIYTVDTLVTNATAIATKYKYKGIDETLANKKAILEGMIVVTSENDLYGVIDYNTGKELLGTQYDKITYIPHKSAFLINKNNKVGIISSEGVTNVRPIYDNLTLIDYENELYLAQNDGLYGVVNIKGDTVIYLEYNKIGIDVGEYEQNGVKSGYVLLNKLIPVQQNNKWGFYDVTGRRITELKYDRIGCNMSTGKSTSYNLLVVPEYNVIVVNRNNKYTFMNLDGEEVIPCVFKNVYIEIASGKKEYYMIWQDNEGKDRTYIASDYLK